jgi:hypothetical protein
MKLVARTYQQSAQTIYLLIGVLLLCFFWKHQIYFLYLAAILSGISAFSTKLVVVLDNLWMRLAWLLGQFVPRILLAVIFYLVLTPLALLAKLVGEKDPLHLKHSGKSLFKECPPNTEKASFEKMW